MKNDLPADTLFHYCSSDAFLSILGNRSLRLSAITQSNDAMEGKSLAHIVAHLAIGSGMDLETLTYMQGQIVSMQNTSDAYGFCLSTEGDLLSQWRGYADDGAGIAIGFSRAAIQELAWVYRESGAGLTPIVYAQDQQAAIVKPHFDTAYAAFQKAPSGYGRKGLLDIRSDKQVEDDNLALAMAQATLFEVIFELILPSYAFKSQAFGEEKEWRLLDTMRQRPQEDRQFRARGSQIIPFLEYKFGDLAERILTCVVLGPKHTTPMNVINDFLQRSGYRNFSLHQSELTYR